MTDFSSNPGVTGGGVSMTVTVDLEHPVESILEQLHAAEAELQENHAVIAAELERVTAAIALLEGAGSTETPASGRPAHTRDAGLPQPVLIQAGAGVSVDPDQGERPRRGPVPSVTADEVLAWMRENATDWTRMGLIAAAFPLVSKSMLRRMAELLERGDIERAGERGGVRYRVKAAAPTPLPQAAEVPANLGQPTPLKPEQTKAEDSDYRRDLERKILGVLERSGPVDAKAIATSLVVPLAEVADVLRQAVQESQEGRRFPKLARHDDGRYSISIGARAAA